MPRPGVLWRQPRLFQGMGLLPFLEKADMADRRKTTAKPKTSPGGHEAAEKRRAATPDQPQFVKRLPMFSPEWFRACNEAYVEAVRREHPAHEIW